MGARHPVRRHDEREGRSSPPPSATERRSDASSAAMIDGLSEAVGVAQFAIFEALDEIGNRER